MSLKDFGRHIGAATVLGTVWGRTSVLLGLLVLLGSGVLAEQPTNMAGSMTMSVWGIESQGETLAHFRWSGGAYAPTDLYAVHTRGTILSHPYFKMTAPEAAELAAGIRVWLQEHHNNTVYRIPGPMGLSFTGNTGILWGKYQPVVIVSCQFWIVLAERGEIHGEAYIPLDVANIEALAGALEKWTANPTVTSEALFSTTVQ